MHSHFNVVGIDIDVLISSTEQHVVIFNDRPFAWGGGSPLWGSHTAEFSRVFIDATPAGDPSCCEQVWKIMEEEKCNHAFILPAFLTDTLCGSMTPYKLNNIVTGGQIVDPKFAGLIGSWTDTLVVVYGSSEVHVNLIELYPATNTITFALLMIIFSSYFHFTSTDSLATEHSLCLFSVPCSVPSRANLMILYWLKPN